MSSNRISTYVWAFIVGLTLLLLARDVIGIQYSKIILIGYSIAFCFCSKTQDLAPMISFLFPLAWGLPYTYIFLGVILLYWLKRRAIPRTSFIAILFYALLEIIASCGYAEADYVAIVKYISVLSIFFTFLYDKSIDKKTCIKTYYIGSMVLCGIILIATLKNAPFNWLYLFSSGWFRFGAKHAADAEGMILAVNANTLAYYSVVGTALSFCFIFNQNRKGLGRYLIGLFLFLITGILTVSISWLVVMGVCIGMLLVEQIKKKNTWIYIFLIGSCSMGIGYYFLSKHPDILTGFLTRFNTADIATADGRTTILIDYGQTILENPRLLLMGAGVTQYTEVFNISAAMHNMLGQIFICYGIFGGLIFLGLILCPLGKLFKKSTALVFWIPLVAVLLFTQTIQFVHPEPLMLPYVIAYYVLASSFAEIDHTKNQNLQIQNRCLGEKI